MTGTKEDYINYRIERAKQTLKDASILIEQGSYISAINRLYYASFYSVHALLTKNGISSKTHSGTKTKFFQEFILKGKIDKEFSKLYSDLFDWRQQGDYSDFAEFEEELVKPLPEKVKLFIKEIESLLK
jgi:uncharacterized protein (UPF0332 family)